MLNPKLVRVGDSVEPHLSDVKLARVRRLAAKGRIAWVSSWQGDMIAKLEAQLHLEAEPLRVTITMRPGDEDRPTPKLRSVARWLDRMDAAGEADWDAVVWIDDVLGPDVHEWAHTFGKPVLLEKPDPVTGLTDAHVVAVQVFINEQGVGTPTHKEQP
ncbi:hypothetical protein J2T22_001639 [Pseudarthrobacter defluvii]|uniref:Uncharacterized protein n=1 Tax=Pseudarthrobacter defluvii TaxID=410837 RepID=A0ABT9UFP2_9MICC|nr:hypothetical protein [Pseudarthrobacter defluvii]